jgi:hypothetical protein
MSQKTAAPPAVPLEIFLPHLAEFYILRFVYRFRKEAIFRKYRRIAAQYFTVDQCVAEGIRLPTKFCDIGSWAWTGSTETSKEADCSWIGSWTDNSWLDQTKCGNSHTSYETRNQGLFYESISSSNHSGLGKFVRSSLPGRNHPNEKCLPKRAASVSSVRRGKKISNGTTGSVAILCGVIAR